MIRAGSPGVRWMSMKTPTVTRNATGTISTRRRRTYVVMPDQVSGMTFPRTIGESLALPDLRHPDHQVGIEREVVDLGVGDLRADTKRGENVRRVLRYLFLRAVVVLLPLALVGVGASVVQPGVDLRVAVQAVVEVAARVPPGVHVAVRVDPS